MPLDDLQLQAKLKEELEGFKLFSLAFVRFN